MPRTTTSTSIPGDTGSSVQEVPPYVTIGILVAGFVGGLVIVIAVIVICKYCVRKEKNFYRDYPYETTGALDCSETRFQPLQRYETINSDMFSEQSTGSMDGLSVTHRGRLDTGDKYYHPESADISGTTQLTGDLDRDEKRTSIEEVQINQYSSAYQLKNELDIRPRKVCLNEPSIVANRPASVNESQRCAGVSSHDNNTATEDDRHSRRVSFQLEEGVNVNQYTPNSRRYTEGDYHHLKRSRIDKKVTRQYSLCTEQPSAASSTNQFHQSATSSNKELTRDLSPACGTTVSTTSDGLDLSLSPGQRSTDFYFEDEYIGCMKPESLKSASIGMTLGDSPSPEECRLPKQTQIYVEVHNTATPTGSDEFLSYSNQYGQVPNIAYNKRLRSQSHSLDTNTYTVRHDERRVKSYENLNYDMLNITGFKGPFYNTDFDVISELGSPGGSKVRYNDTGSMEVLNEEKLEQMDMDCALNNQPYDVGRNELGDMSCDSPVYAINKEPFDVDHVILEQADDTATLNGAQKYREIWNLRSTLEEEEECSDTIRMEDMTSPEESPDFEAPKHNSLVGSKSNFVDQQRVIDRAIQSGEQDTKNNSQTSMCLHGETRTQNYKNVLAMRLQGFDPNLSNDNSFDSMETGDTGDTDGEVSDISRQEVMTSFESATDNTDSTTESINHRLIQMKADSGYKSLETQPNYVKRHHSTSEIEVLEEDDVIMDDIAIARPYIHSNSLPETGPSDGPYCQKSKYFERRNGKTASKKRREFSRERQIVQIYDSIYEPDNNESKSDKQMKRSVKYSLPESNRCSFDGTMSNDINDQNSFQMRERSYIDPPTTSKLSLFTRFFRSSRDHHRERLLGRDYSIDEKTNKVFQEFVRYDPNLDIRRRTSKQAYHGRHRLQRKHTDPAMLSDKRIDKLTPDMRSASLGSDRSRKQRRRPTDGSSISLGSDSSASSARKISPQDSIEEEDFEQVKREEQEGWREDSNNTNRRQSLSVQAIPIIHLPEEELCTDV